MMPPAPAASAIGTHQSTSTAASRLARNTLLNFGGQIIPVAAGVVAIPLLTRGLGTSRFGVLTLAWMSVGYFSLFDLGLGRALTKLVAERISAEEQAEIPKLAWTALALMFVFGMIGSVAGIALTPWLTHRVLRIPAELQGESTLAFWLLALSLPVVITGTGLRGLLEAMHRFDWVNAIRVPSGVFTFAGPLLILPFSNSLVPIVAVLVAARVVAWIAHLVLCARAIPGLIRPIAIDATMVRLLLRFGGWMTVTNIVGPVMVYMDRLLIGATVSAAAVAYYAAPYEVITKMWLVPGALLGVLFPAFSAGLRTDPEWVKQTFTQSVELLLMILFPMSLVAVVFAEEGLRLWLGAEFAVHGAVVAKWLAAGVLINSLALVPFTLIQGGGRPDLTAKVHLAELGPYLLGLWWFTTRYGIVGAAIIWTIRAAADAVILFALVRGFLPQGSQVVRRSLMPAACATVALGLGVLPGNVFSKIAYVSLVLAGTGVLAWIKLPAGFLNAWARPYTQVP
jgi:O-antigen/teichoic acid export membrane protein